MSSNNKSRNVFSGRIRSAPSTGRSNIGNAKPSLFAEPNMSDRPKSRKNYNEKRELLETILQNRAIQKNHSDIIERDKVNCHVRVLGRPFTPEANEFTSDPPILPKSIEPTIPPPESKKLFVRPLICPDGWIENNQKPPLYDRSAFHSVVYSDEEKKEHCKDFVERNRDSLWKYDTNYLNKTPRTVYKELTGEYFYLNKMTNIHHKERVMKQSNSNAILSCLSGDRSSSKLPDSRDPFVSTLSTSREDKRSRMERLLSPALSPEYTLVKFRRGYKHTPEYGNFSQFNSVLKNNESSALKR